MANLAIVKQLSSEMSLKDFQVLNTITLIVDEDCTVPFVARYRKEKTGSLDEVAIRDIRDRYLYLQDLESTKLKYLKVVEEHCLKRPELAGKFPELKRKFEACTTKNELEDLYLPFKPKRRTRAQIAKEKGLQSLFDKLIAESASVSSLLTIAEDWITKGKEGVDPTLQVASAEEALAGAGDIWAEVIAETPELRAKVREMSSSSGMLVSKVIDGAYEAKAGEDPKKQSERLAKAKKYEIYYDYKESMATAPSHRIMAVRRGEAEKVLRVDIEVDAAAIVFELKSRVLSQRTCSSDFKAWAEGVVEDAYKRLISPSIETEIRLELKRRAEEEAIGVFSKNLQNLLLLPPIPGTVVMGIDPGLRTGCKLAVVSETGKLLDHATVYPDPRNPNGPKSEEAKKQMAALIAKHQVTCVAIGNGTGSREIDRLVLDIIKSNDLKQCKRLVVNEAGASVYSTDPIAREEFPDLDPTIRSAVSIARRLQDPLAELVKIDPRSIGVGQYQHDVNVTKLNRSLTEVVESCVNRVGVNLNTASFKLLSYVSGIGPALAKGIVEHRNQKGRFQSRRDLTEVNGLGAKVFQQAAGFLRVPDGDNPLDNSAVHPESYGVVENMAKDLNKPVQQLIGQQQLIEAIPLERYVTATIGVPTLQDIASELIKPGRDPREDGSRLMYSDEVSEVSDLKLGMKLKGTVSNVTAFGAFVDIGVHQDGLVHISELSDQFIKDPGSVVSVGDVIDVRVIDVDIQRKRISLSCKSEPSAQTQDPRQGRVGARSGSDQKQSERNNTPRGNKPSGDRHRQRNAKQASSSPEVRYSMDDLLSKFNQFSKGAKK